MHALGHSSAEADAEGSVDCDDGDEGPLGELCELCL